VYLLLRIFQIFSPIRITTFTAFAVLQGIRGSILQLNTLRLSTVAKSAIADFRFYDKLDKSCHEGTKNTKMGWSLNPLGALARKHFTLI